MGKQLNIASSVDSIICPACGISELYLGDDEGSAARCNRCESILSGEMLKTLGQIAALPDALGNHPCEECGHPEMRRLPDSIWHCPSCGSDVAPAGTYYISSGSVGVTEAYLCGWADGLFGRMESFICNEGLARWQDAHDRLDYYRGHRAGQAIRF